MFYVYVYNDKSVVYNDQHPQGKLEHMYQEALRTELAYDVPDAEWSAKFKQGQWDGKISIYNKREQSFPTGLTNKVKKLFDIINIEYKFIDKREKPELNFPVDVDFGGKELRDYQLSSGVLSKKYQRGMLALCTGAGKTMTSCQIFKELAVSPVVFIVPAIELLKQTQKEFEKYLRLNGQPVKVGIAGGGICEINLEGINVITYQTALNSHNKKYVESQKKVVDDNVEGSKTSAQLQNECEFAHSAYKKAVDKANINLKDLLQEFINAQENQHKDAEAIRKKYERSLNLATKIELAAYKKTKTAWDNRQDILFQKAQVREVLSECQAFIVDEAHVASVVIEELGEIIFDIIFPLKKECSSI
jgi:predicted helicase